MEAYFAFVGISVLMLGIAVGEARAATAAYALWMLVPLGRALLRS